MALIRTYPRCLGDAFMATSKSASETFSRLGIFGNRAMPRIDHIPDPNARKIAEQSDKTFGNRYMRHFRGRAAGCLQGAGFRKRPGLTRRIDPRDAVPRLRAEGGISGNPLPRREREGPAPD